MYFLCFFAAARPSHPSPMAASATTEAVLLCKCAARVSTFKDAASPELPPPAPQEVGAAGPALELLSVPQGDHDLVMLRKGDFSYPLVGQPVLRLALRRYLFSGADAADTKVLVELSEKCAVPAVLELEEIGRAHV